MRAISHLSAAPIRFPAELVEADIERCGRCMTDPPLDFAFDYAFQPIVDLATRSVYAHEALIRGPAGEPAHTVLSRVTPSNLYRFDQACRVHAIASAVAVDMQEALSINFFPNAIYKPEVCIRTTLTAAREHGFRLDRLIFEVSETECVSDRKRLANIMAEYRRMGFTTAIDDFGAGYAGLNLLADFQPDLIKLDMDLVRAIDAHPARRAIVRGLVAVCRDLGVKLLAEGIETVAERDCLLDLGITLMQGWLFAKPAFKAVAEVDVRRWV